MNTKLMASVSTLALVLAGCASSPTPFVETPEVKYKTAKVEAAVSAIPNGIRKCQRRKVQSLL